MARGKGRGFEKLAYPLGPPSVAARSPTTARALSPALITPPVQTGTRTIPATTQTPPLGSPLWRPATPHPCLRQAQASVLYPPDHPQRTPITNQKSATTHRGGHGGPPQLRNNHWGRPIAPPKETTLVGVAPCGGPQHPHLCLRQAQAALLHPPNPPYKSFLILCSIALPLHRSAVPQTLFPMLQYDR
ncbi:MAG: hypothetical protein GFH27_549279n333 [Chloroflexi bacterium AL-W]|nr:hypothetical protein [Chloroflexi bacterium AL-N1]NOK65299.1 hypothetical protein [Chloroflexi bacterium AL-N10]NOK72436.1 hypothetical protein [Chloroflexi bacterium AL-N5]NOK79478.1 hypothetical protein [Chloroflexi bacterium AL-W]NOK87394.1 hypothetical protein [Chloroflexi bacterium AL-N15]